MIKMKKQNIIPIIALLALVSMMIVPVSATWAELTTGVRAGGAIIGGNIIKGDSVVAENPHDICGYYGLDHAPGDPDYTILAYNRSIPETAAANWSVVWRNAGVGAYWDVTGHTYTIPAGYTDRELSIGQYAECIDGIYYIKTWYHYYNSSAYASPVSAFTCSNLNALPNTYIPCVDTSTSPSNITKWDFYIYNSVGDQLYFTSKTSLVNSNLLTFTLSDQGLYTAKLHVFNDYSNDWENKTDYINVSINATPNNCEIEPIPGYIRTYAQTNDGMTSGGIYNSNIQMHDMEGGAWSNVTNSGGWWCIDTLPGHSLNIYAQATGYTSAETLGASANGGRHYLVMWPDYIPAPSAGNVTLYALVYDQQTGAPLYLSMVRVDGNTINTVLTTTGLEGQAMFTIKNDTSIHVTASKTGYSSITKVITTSHFGPDTVMISLPRLTVTTIPTATPGPGGTTPVYVDPRTTIQKDADMMNQIRDAGPGLIGLAIVATIFGLIRLMTKK